MVLYERLADYINMLLEKSYKDMQIDTQEKYEYLSTEIKKSEIRKDKLLDMYMDGDISKDLWTSKTSKIEKQITLLENNLKSMKLSNDEFINKGKNIIECSKQAYNLYKNQDTKEKRKLLDVLFESITVENREVKYVYKKPFCYFAQCDMNNADEFVDYIKKMTKNEV